MGFHAVKTQSGQEERAVDEVVKNGGIGVESAIAPQGMSGYIIAEGVDRDAVRRAVEASTHARKLLPGETSFTEVKGFLSPSSDVEGFGPGDRVHITGGPYEGQKARIKTVDSDAEQATVELNEATIPIPVAIPGSHLRTADE